MHITVKTFFFSKQDLYSELDLGSFGNYSLRQVIAGVSFLTVGGRDSHTLAELSQNLTHPIST